MMHTGVYADSLAMARSGRGRRFLLWLARLRARRRRAALRVSLDALNDHQLRDIGLARDTIADLVARYARYPTG